jgi:hypothetical protein
MHPSPLVDHFDPAQNERLFGLIHVFFSGLFTQVRIFPALYFYTIKLFVEYDLVGVVNCISTGVVDRCEVFHIDVENARFER